MLTPARMTEPDPTRAPVLNTGGARAGSRPSGSRQDISLSLTVRTPAPRNTRSASTQELVTWLPGEQRTSLPIWVARSIVRLCPSWVSLPTVTKERSSVWWPTTVFSPILVPA
ncbi:MAG: hypothetical protein JWM19_372 [Actinomycetia bacterium]|nr:hypothetical protein [Actinomycetes bacterium]